MTTPYDDITKKKLTKGELVIGIAILTLFAIAIAVGSIVALGPGNKVEVVTEDFAIETLEAEGVPKEVAEKGVDYAMSEAEKVAKKP